MNTCDGGYSDWERQQDAREFRALQLRQAQEWAAAMARVQPEPPAEPSRPRKKRPAPGTSPRAKALRSWRRRAALGRSDRCGRCRRRTIRHHARGLCRSCYGVVSGAKRRDYSRNKQKQRKWKMEHRDLCCFYSRKYSQKASAKKKLNARLRRQRRLRRLERIRRLRLELHDQRAKFRQIPQVVTS